MGQKVSPIATRIPLTRKWQSHWFADRKSFASRLQDDLKIRSLIEKRFTQQAAIARVEIAQRQTEIEVTLHSARPGILIGRQGQGIAEIRKLIERELGHPVKIEIKEVRKPEAVASLVAQTIGNQLIRQIAYRRAAKQAIEKAMQAGAKGIKIRIAGRLGGKEIARTETFSKGLIPTTVLKHTIDFAVHHAQTRYGTIGIKVWVYKETEPSEES